MLAACSSSTSSTAAAAGGGSTPSSASGGGASASGGSSGGVDTAALTTAQAVPSFSQFAGSYGGKELALFKRLRGGEFCSDAHRLRYQEEYTQLALNRLLQANSSKDSTDPVEPDAAFDIGTPVALLVGVEPAWFGHASILPA